MANIPCTNRIVCPGPTPSLDADDPIINFSSEAVDGINFTEMSWPITDFTNPFTSDDPNNPPDSCDSPISQEEAELCAIRKVFIDQATRNGTSANLFFSTEQTCAFQCPDGSSFFWSVPAGAFVDFNQLAANQRAKDYACQQAALNAVCIAVDTTSACLNSPFLSVVSVTGGTGGYAIKLITGTLPPGIGFVQDTATTAFFSGTPTVAGSYPVLISARDSKGNTITRTITIAVLAISNSGSVPTPAVGTFYNFQLQGSGGTGPYTFSGGAGLPGGLVLQSDGFIVGNPVAPIGTGFSATITDSTGHACTFSLTYATCSFFKTAVWNSPQDVFLTPAQPGDSYTFAETFPVANAVELNGSAVILVIDQPLVVSNTAVVTLPNSNEVTCQLTINFKAVSGATSAHVAVHDLPQITNFFSSPTYSNPPPGSTTFTFTIPAGNPQVKIAYDFQCGLPFPPAGGSMDLRIDFGV